MPEININIRISLSVLLMLFVFACNRTDSNTASVINQGVIHGSILDVEVDHLYKLNDPHVYHHNNQVFFNLELWNETKEVLSYKQLFGKIDDFVDGFNQEDKTLELVFDSTIIISNGTDRSFGLESGVVVVESSDNDSVLQPGEKAILKCRLMSSVDGFSLLHVMSIYQNFFESGFWMKSVSTKPQFVFTKKSSFKIKYKLDHKSISGKDMQSMENTDNQPDGFPPDKGL